MSFDPFSGARYQRAEIVQIGEGWEGGYEGTWNWSCGYAPHLFFFISPANVQQSLIL